MNVAPLSVECEATTRRGAQCRRLGTSDSPPWRCHTHRDARAAFADAEPDTSDKRATG